MNRDEREQALWHDAYMLSMSQDPSPAESSGWADAAVAEFRKRYPVEPAAPAPTAPGLTWYDEPPFEKIDKTNYCWVQDIDSPQGVYWSNLSGQWRFFEGVSDTRPLNGRRVCPIHKPQEPTT